MPKEISECLQKLNSVLKKGVHHRNEIELLPLSLEEALSRG